MFAVMSIGSSIQFGIVVISAFACFVELEQDDAKERVVVAFYIQKHRH
jgi:hypothetical protein